MEIVLYPTFETGRVIVEARFVSNQHRQLVTQTGYSQLVLYPRENDFPHTVAGLIMLGQIDVQCANGDTPQEAYHKIQRRFAEVVEILQIAELGGTPQPYRRPAKQQGPLGISSAEGVSFSIFRRWSRK